MSHSAIRSWRDRLRHADLSDIARSLSPRGHRDALDAALDALDDTSLESAWSPAGQPFTRATLLAAATVTTAPIEWCAVLLGRGAQVTLKVSSRAPGLASVLAQTARSEGLPLTVTTRRDVAMHETELLVAMGSDATIAAVKAHVRPHTRYLGFGHRFSVAWVTTHTQWDAVADDLTLHDGRGCMSPTWILTSLDPVASAQHLSRAMAARQRDRPLGVRADAEHGQIRARRALGQVLGHVLVRPDHEIHVLPTEHVVPGALPRCVALSHVPHRDDVHRLLHPWRPRLSTVGTDDPSLPALGAVRVCALGQMQRPPLQRLHDGIDWLRETWRQPPISG